MIEFDRYVMDPSQIIRNYNEEYLQLIIEKYPWFQTAHLFRFFGENTNGNLFENKYLPETVVYAGSRKKLVENTNLLPHWKKFFGEINQDGFKDSDYEKHPERKKAEVEILIEKFILESPSVRRPKSEFFSPEEAASRSVSEESSFISETLANIYANAGNYQKAIRIYQKLCLLNPEKSTYFADQIELLNNKIDE